MLRYNEKHNYMYNILVFVDDSEKSKLCIQYIEENFAIPNLYKKFVLVENNEKINKIYNVRKMPAILFIVDKQEVLRLNDFTMLHKAISKYIDYFL